MWRWKEAAGQIHYSNVPDHVPSHAAAVYREVGYLAPAPLAQEVAPATDPARLRKVSPNATSDTIFSLNVIRAFPPSPRLTGSQTPASRSRYVAGLPGG